MKGKKNKYLERLKEPYMKVRLKRSGILLKNVETPIGPTFKTITNTTRWECHGTEWIVTKIAVAGRFTPFIMESVWSMPSALSGVIRLDPGDLQWHARIRYTFLTHYFQQLPPVKVFDSFIDAMEWISLTMQIMETSIAHTP